MGKYSSDSDSEKRKSYKSRSKRRSSSSSSSESRSRKRRHNRSRSRDRYSKSRRSSKSRRRSRSRHRDRHRRHRRSRSYIKEYTSKPRRRSTSSSSDSEPKNEEIPKNEARKSPEVSKVDVKVVNAINEEGFTPKSYTSKSKMMENIVIDLKKQTIKVPEVEPVEPDSIFHHNLFLNEEARMEKWIKELYGYRQRALQQGLKTVEK
ncbi:serine/Arginine-related protein 53-like [Tribolium madens]|uniref:serine/Arginine-related protein 53-like n=1 Tax=Tribolium madens TaxID=41895 RepID=UPI001CF75E0A|nr:serine/Arginine-related protein 53-like [Tribolium madens]